MYLYTDNEKIKIPNSVLLNIIGVGSQVFAYKYGNKVLKIYKHFQISLPDLTCHKILTTLDTKQIILPNEIFYNKKGKYISNTSKYVKPIHNSILEYSFEDYVSITEYLENDIYILCENNIKIADLKISNFVFGDGIYLVDFGNFKLEEDTEFLLKYNFYNLKNFLRLSIIDELEKRKSLTKEINKFYINSLDRNILLSDYLKQNYNEVEKIFKKTCK
jgi:hypothetical protein